MSCPGHSVTVAAVPWARHGARHTRAFEDTIAWLACAASKATICELMRTGWRTIGHIITRVAAEAAAGTDRLAGLQRIGIDEISYRKGHKYLVVVVDHDTGLLIWAAPGRTMKTVASFFDALGPDRTAALTHVSADGASYIATVVSARAPAATQCTDPFHVVSWAADTLDQVRREVWQAARAQPGGSDPRRRGRRIISSSTGDARSLKRTRYALWKNPDNLTDRQQAKLASIEKTHPYLYRAWLLKEGIRVIFALKGQPEAASKRSPDGSSGPPAAASRNSSSSANPQAPRPASWPPSTTACPTGSSNQSIPRYGSSPAWHTDSTAPKPSSPWPCSASEVSAPPSPAAETTHGTGREPHVDHERK